MPIHILPDNVISQIAAGEVVERPASVVKELIENAIDAAASRISIKVTGAGRNLIEVGDDGQGIPASEIPLSMMRHATSKLTHLDDLFHIQTLGFRGEALASIGSVSRLTLFSYNGEGDVGFRMLLEGGKPLSPQPVGIPRGTVVRVESLFYNVPARLKFLKAEGTEKRHMITLVTRYALAYPHIRWKFDLDEKIELQTSGNGDRREILSSLYGVSDARQMLDLEFKSEELSITGFISPFSLTRSTRKDIILFVNGRWVQDSSLTAAIIKAYHTLLMVGRYPMAVIFIQLPPEMIDVNVHPAKAEVRFRDPDKIFSEVQRAVRRGLLAYSPIPSIPVSSYWGAQPRSIDPAWELSRSAHSANQPVQAEIDAVNKNENEKPVSLLPGIPLLRLLGQVALTYLVAEGPDGIYLIDQHAAHERVLFERLTHLSSTSATVSQALLSPVVVELSADQAVLLNKQLGILAQFGFEVDPFGPNAFKIRSIPQIATGSDPGKAVLSLVEAFEEDESPFAGDNEARIAARVCKRMAIKAGQALSSDEQKTLLADLEGCHSPRTCPHGRPTMIHLSADLLERQFGRAGAR